MVWLCSLRLWGMLTKRSLTYSISLIREFRRSQLIKFHIRFSLKINHH
ncbi:hypothetical protein Gotur_028772 [Gossypium turneri]